MSDPGELLELLAVLHRHKDAAYGDAWRRRGEVVGIFANLARKYDRLAIAMTEREPAAVESLADTCADLCVYAAKYLTWLAETQPAAFAAVPPAPYGCAADLGASAVERVFAALPDWERDAGLAPPATAAPGWGRVHEAFTELERGLLAQAQVKATAPLLEWSRKIELTWALTDAAAWMLTHLGEQQLHPLREAVTAMGPPP